MSTLPKTPQPPKKPTNEEYEDRTATFPSSIALLKETAAFARDAPLGSTDQAVATRFVTLLCKLFPERIFCLQLLARDPETPVRIEGGSPPVTSRPMQIDMVEGHHAAKSISTDQRQLVCWVQGDFLAHPSSQSGFHIDLPSEGGLLGTIFVEYCTTDTSSLDQPLIAPLCDLLASSLLGAREHRRSQHHGRYVEDLLEHANAPIVLTDREGRIAFVNAAYCAATGFSDAEILGEALGTTLSTGTAQRLIKPLLNALRGRATSDTELLLRQKSGKEVPFSVNCAAVRSAHGGIDGALLIYRDISKLRELQDQIIQSEKLATLGQMAAGVVHELNNPLTSITVYADYLLERHKLRAELTDDLKKLSTISESAQRIQRFSQDLITYARPSNEVPTRTSVHETLRRSIGFCEHLITTGSVAVDLLVDDGLPDLLAVPEQLVQVWINLFTNACHAMSAIDPGHAKLSITARRHNREAVLIVVADNGAGVPERARAAL